MVKNKIIKLSPFIYIQKGLGLDINGYPNWPLGVYSAVYGVYLGGGVLCCVWGVLGRGRTLLLVVGVPKLPSGVMPSTMTMSILSDISCGKK